MIKVIVSILNNHASLFIMGLGSLGLFAANVSLKTSLDPNQYYFYSITVTVITLLTSFGALGIDQVFLRLSRISKKNEIKIDKKILPFAVFNSVVMSLLACHYLVEIIGFKENKLVVFICCIGVIWVMLIYNIFRIVSFFSLSQIIQNSWKIFLGLLCLVVFFKNDAFDYFLSTLSIFISITIAVSIYLLKKHVRVYQETNTKNHKEIVFFSFHFFLALLTLSFLSQGDRFIIERSFDRQEFGDYFFMATLFLFPFSFLQSYIGFKELVYIKNGTADINKKVKNVFFKSILFSVVLFFLIAVFSRTNFLNLDINRSLSLVLLFIIIGNVKMIYSLFSAIIGVKASINEIKKMNIIFIILSIIIFSVSLKFKNSLFKVLALFCVLWIVRLLIWYFFSKKYITNAN